MTDHVRSAVSDERAVDGEVRVVRADAVQVLSEADQPVLM